MPIDRRTFIKHAGVALAGSSTLYGAATETSGEPFSFAVIADPHCSEATKPGIEAYGDGVQKFLTCIEAIKRLDENKRPDFVLVVGDVHVWALKDSLPDVDIPLYPVAGNHESTPDKRAELRSHFPKCFAKDGLPSDYYSFVHKGVRFIGLCDAGLGGEHVGQFCSENTRPSGQCEWIEAQFDSPERRKIMFAHIPPEPKGADKNMYLSRNDSRWFNELVCRKKPEAMFFGHLHQATHEYPIGSTRCFNVRSCCWNFGNAPLGFLLVEVTAEGLVTHEIETGKYT